MSHFRTATVLNSTDVAPRTSTCNLIRVSLAFGRRWVPSSARFVVLGTYARNTGCIQVSVCHLRCRVTGP